MTIIKFNPTSWEGTNNINSTQTDAIRHNSFPEEYDSCEFVDYELTEEENQGVFSKLKAMFAHEKSINPKKQQKAFEKARNVLCHSIITRDQVATILDMMTSEKSKQYAWKLYNEGVVIRFAQDEMGRPVMEEEDLEGNLTRATTFDRDTLKLIYIDTPTKNGKDFDRIVFYNKEGTHFEVKKGIKNNRSMKEFYSFVGSEPVSYKKDCTQTSSGIVGKEEYNFVDYQFAF